MASFERRGRRWRVRVYVDGKRDSATHATKAAAAAWAVMREAELAGTALPSRTVAQALQRYADEVSPTHRGERWERVRLAAIARDWGLARNPLTAIKPADIAAWRDARLRQVAPASVAREMTLLRLVFEQARREWGWLAANPMADVRRPGGHQARSRRVSDAEIERVCFALGWDMSSVAATAAQRVAVAFCLAVETAMRSGELCSLTWDQVMLGERYARLERTKNGDARDVPLSSRAIELIALLPRIDARMLALDDATRDVLFRRARDAVGVDDLRFHDARHEATTRLARRLDVLDLARMTGHRDLKSLRRYYNPTATEIADRLG